MKQLRLLAITATLLLTQQLSLQAEPCMKTCSQCCPSSSPCCPTANCTKICSECCKKDDSCCTKNKKSSDSASVPLERGGKKSSPYADKGCLRRY